MNNILQPSQLEDWLYKSQPPEGRLPESWLPGVNNEDICVSFLTSVTKRNRRHGFLECLEAVQLNPSELAADVSFCEYSRELVRCESWEGGVFFQRHLIAFIN